MGNKLRDEDLKLNIIVNGDKGKKELGDLEKSTRNLTNRNKELRAEKEKLIRAGKKETEEFKSVTREIRENNSAIKTNEARMTELRKEIGLTGLTMRQLRTEQTRLKRLMDTATHGTPQWKMYRTELGKVEKQMGKVQAGSHTMQFSMSKMANGINRYIGLITAAAATLTGIAFSMKEWTKGLVGLDDAIADVRKTTGLTREEVRGMYTDFKYLNTRTPRKELLLLAEEAGRLGIEGKKNIEDFVEVANQIKVALGDDLGGEAEVAIREVGKLAEVYKIGEQYGIGFKESLNKIGSAINEVSANSNSQAPFQIGFLKRMGGVSMQAKISAADILGYASTYDQLGQTQEIAATAHGKTIISMFKDHAEYAKIANMEAGEFYNLLQTDANEAFLNVMDGLNGNNEGLSVMAKKLDDLGIDGARAVQALAALSSNTKMVREQQALANKAMEDGTSLTNEYNIKNNNLAGSMDKLGRHIRAQFINSNFLAWMEKIVAKTAEWVEQPISEKIRKEQTELNLLVASITNAANSQETRNSFIAELQQTYPDFLDNLDAEKVTNEELAIKLKEVNEQYENKILLAVKEEKLADNYKQRTDLKLEELRIIKEIARYEEIAANARTKVAGETDPNKLRTLLSDEEIAALNAMDLLPRKLETIRGEFQGLLNDEAELNAAIKQLMTGGGTGAGSGTGGTGGAGGTGGKANGGTSSFSYEEESEDPLGLDSWMTSSKWDNIGAEELAAKKASEEEWTAFLMAEVKKRTDSEAKALGIEEEIADARVALKDIQVAAVGQLANSLAGMFEQGSAAQIAMIAVEKAIAIAQIWMNLAREKSAINLAAAQMSTIPFVGPALAATYKGTMTAKALTTAKINTGLVLAQTVASTVSSSQRKKSQAYADGKYPDRLNTGTYGDKPHYAVFNEVPGEPEMVVDGKTFRKMQMNYPELINAIYNIRDGKTSGGYATGKYASGANENSQAYGVGTAVDIDKFDKAVDKLMEWEPEISITDIKARLARLERFNKQSKLN